KGAAAIEATNVALPRSKRRDGRRSHTHPPAFGSSAVGERHRCRCCILERYGGVNILVSHSVWIGAKKIDDHRLACATGCLHYLDGYFLRRKYGNAADIAVQIVSARTDRLRDAASPSVDQAGHLLEAGAGCADDTDDSAPHHIRERKRDAVDNGSSASGPMTMRSRSWANRLSAISSLRSTLSL